MRHLFSLSYALAFALLVATTTLVNGNADPTSQQSNNDAFGVTKALNSAEEALQKLAALSQQNFEQSKIAKLSEELDLVQETSKKVAQLNEQRDALIRQANAKQIRRLIQRLEAISVQEQKRREAGKDGDSTSTSTSSSSSSTSNSSKDNLPSNWESQLDPPTILKDSEDELEAWILKLAQEELERIPLASTQEPQSDECLTTANAVTELKAALDRFALDGIGKLDLLQLPGTSIVHEHTSSTYQPPLEAPNPAQYGWYQYVPQDLLWLQTALQFNLLSFLSSLRIPDHVYHTLGLAARGNSITAPPETILQDSLLPGACWPVGMNGGGDDKPLVTIRLPTPATITAITLDHVSKLLVDDRSSAPKKVKVYGYAACDSCQGLGFDRSSKMLLAEIIYDLNERDGGNIQTFEVETSPKAAVSEDGSCAASYDAGTCGGGGDATATVAAVSLEILENWGHADYTCLYRFRVHGEPVA